MALEQIPLIEEISWKDAKGSVLPLNSQLSKAIDAVNPNKKHSFFKVRYPFGSKILNKAKLQIPNSDGEIVPIDDKSIDAHTKLALGYNLNSNPVTMVLKNTIELFVPLEDRTIPLYGPIVAGTIFGLYRILSPERSHQPAFIWDMTAGARSIFMLPRISCSENHQKIKKAFRLRKEVPTSLMEHWELFKHIANHEDFPTPWCCEVLFFSREWFEHQKDKAWSPFNEFLLETAWRGNEFWRNQFSWNMIFSIIQKIRNLKPSIYIDDTVKYLFAIGVGESPGFAPAINDCSAPISGLQKVYDEIYGLRRYAPIIMQPSMFGINIKNRLPVYYSLQFPNAVEFGQQPRRRSNFTTDLSEISYLLDKYMEEIKSGQFNVEGTPLYELTKTVKFDYFHAKKDSYNITQSSIKIPKEDGRFLGKFSRNNNVDFPIMSSFVTPCIRIANKS